MVQLDRYASTRSQSAGPGAQTTQATDNHESTEQQLLENYSSTNKAQPVKTITQLSGDGVRIANLAQSTS